METRRPDPQSLTPRRRSPPRKAGKAMAIADALALLQEHGFQVQAPDLHHEMELREQAGEALGIQEHSGWSPTKARAKRLAETRNHSITLVYPHSINGVIYGPGVVKTTDTKLLATLVSKDQLSKEQEARVFETVGRCHIIVNRVDSYGRQAAYGQPVDASVFNSPQGLMGGQVYREFSAADVTTR